LILFAFATDHMKHIVAQSTLGTTSFDRLHTHESRTYLTQVRCDCDFNSAIEKKEDKKYDFRILISTMYSLKLMWMGPQPIQFEIELVSAGVLSRLATSQFGARSLVSCMVCALAPLLFSNTAAGWFERVVTSDASSVGLGVVATSDEQHIPHTAVVSPEEAAAVAESCNWHTIASSRGVKRSTLMC
jgi:hypothetical protein